MWKTIFLPKLLSMLVSALDNQANATINVFNYNNTIKTSTTVSEKKIQMMKDI